MGEGGSYDSSFSFLSSDDPIEDFQTKNAETITVSIPARGEDKRRRQTDVCNARNLVSSPLLDRVPGASSVTMRVAADSLLTRSIY